jgi:hypothetical protein
LDLPLSKIGLVILLHRLLLAKSLHSPNSNLVVRL